MESQCLPYNEHLFTKQTKLASAVSEDNPHTKLARQLLATLELFSKNCYDDSLKSFGIKKHHSFNNEMQRREQFGAMLDALELAGINRDVARQEMLALIAGRTSKVLNKFV